MRALANINAIMQEGSEAVNVLKSKNDVIQDYYMYLTKALDKCELAQYFTAPEVVDCVVDVLLSITGRTHHGSGVRELGLPLLHPHGGEARRSLLVGLDGGNACGRRRHYPQGPASFSSSKTAYRVTLHTSESYNNHLP